MYRTIKNASTVKEPIATPKSKCDLISSDRLSFSGPDRRQRPKNPLGGAAAWLQATCDDP